MGNLVEQTDAPLLTIAIPTHNRLACLRLLLESLLQQIATARIGSEIEILVCDNASTDGTSDLLSTFVKSRAIRTVRHKENCGAAANVVRCYALAQSEYVWIIGDDDVPLVGALQAVLECLIHANPDLLFLPAKWRSGDLSGPATRRIKKGKVSQRDSMGMATMAGVHVTFISSWVINRRSYFRSATNRRLEQYEGTSFPQLEWTLELLNRGERLFCANELWLVARGGSSGGYALLEAFSVVYNRIVDEKLSENPRLRTFLRQCMLWSYIPSLVWALRQGRIGKFERFEKERALKVLQSAYDRDIFYRLMVRPIIASPVLVAVFFRALARVWGAVWLSWRRAGAMLQDAKRQSIDVSRTRSGTKASAAE